MTALPRSTQLDDTTEKGAQVSKKHLILTSLLHPIGAAGRVRSSAFRWSRPPASRNSEGSGESGHPRTHRMVRRVALLVALAALAAGLAAGPVAGPAQAANAPWWKLISNSRPTYLTAGSSEPGTDAVFKFKVSITSGAFFLEEPIVTHLPPEEAVIIPVPEPGATFVELPAGASAAEIQAGLEGIAAYGPGNVEVTELAPGEFRVAFVNGAGEQPIHFGGEEEGAPIPVTELTKGATGKADGEIYLTAVNVGDANAIGSKSPITIKDVLPEGLTPVAIAATGPEKEGDFVRRKSFPCEPIALTCTLKEDLVPFDTIEVRIEVEVGPGAHTGEMNEVTMSGGGAPTTTVSRPITVSSAPVPFGVSEYEMGLEEEGGIAPTQAGRHPFQFTTQIAVDQNRDTEPLFQPSNPNFGNKPEVTPAGLAKDFAFKLPPGLIGNATSIPECTTAQFFSTIEGRENRCPADTAVGVAVATVHEPSTAGTATLTEPIFNLEPNFGEPARFGFNVVIANTPVFIGTAVRSGTDYGITAQVPNLTQTGSVLASTATFWGTPGDTRHNAQRGWGCLYEARGLGIFGENQTCVPGTEAHPTPFFSMPTQCTSPLRAEGELDQWNVNQGLFSAFTGLFDPAGLLTGCNQLPFGPTISAEPTTRAAASPTGLNLDLDLGQEGLQNQNGLAESDVKKVTVVLPQGVTTNPSVANGLTACTLAQYEAEALGVQSCPESSKVGEVEIETPLVKQLVKGSVYVARQHDNPADNLLSIYMVAKNPELGVLVKSAGAVTPDPQTGRLSTTFDELPQLPFSHFHFAFRTGQRAPLITPGLCGRYATQADLYPYSDPDVQVHREATFEVTGGANGTPCATQESQLPNKPTLEAGTLTPIAGAYSPFVFKVKRADGSQTLSKIEATLPEGLLGKLAGVTECSNGQIAQAEGRGGEGQGQAELSSPSCPASSQVGVVNVGTGVGSRPYYVQGKAYLAGPYKGAPLSLAIVTPAVVGPFDLGTIVVRTALYVNETTAQITAKSDPIPTIVHGLPTVVQSISLQMNRPEFTLNPTSCDPKQIQGSATSTIGAVAPLAERFQVGACGALGFKPQLKLSLKGATKRAGVPALKAVLTYPKGSYANVASVSTVLPKSEFIDNAHIGNTCTRVQFNAGAGHGAQCPKKSVLGKATAWSPLLDKPLEGTVYLRSNGGERELPDIVAALHGQIDVTLVGFVDSVGKKHSEVSRIRTRFMNVPDAPVSRFVLQLAGANKGILQNSANLCKVKNIAQVKATAQNGKTYDTEPAVANECGKKHKKHKGKNGGKSKNAGTGSKGKK
jgi:hypothetical protein